MTRSPLSPSVPSAPSSAPCEATKESLMDFLRRRKEGKARKETESRMFRLASVSMAWEMRNDLAEVSGKFSWHQDKDSFCAVLWLSPEREGRASGTAMEIQSYPKESSVVVRMVCETSSVCPEWRWSWSLDKDDDFAGWTGTSSRPRMPAPPSPVLSVRESEEFQAWLVAAFELVREEGGARWRM